MSGLESLMPQIQTAGAIGSSVDWASSLYGRVTSTFYSQTAYDPDRLGYALCEAKQINTLSGYIVVEHADVSDAASPIEKESIISFMEGGFYYE